MDKRRVQHVLRLLLPLLFGLLLGLCPAAWADRWSSEVHAQLRQGRPVQVKQLQVALKEELPEQDWEGSTEPWLLTFEDGTRAVFRCEDDRGSSLAELAGYRVAAWLGLQLVPPTQIRILYQEEWPKGCPWPFEQPERVGTCQLFVKSKNFSNEEYQQLDGQRRAEIEILCFLLGRYDNHMGNVLNCSDGLPAVIDFDSTLQEQKVRYGEFAYVVNGRWRREALGVPGSEAFPFDHPHQLVAPTRAQLEAEFAGWSIWPGTLPIMENSAKRGDKTIRYAIWNQRLWIQCRAGSRHPCWTDVYPTPVMERLSQLDEKTLRGLLPVVYTKDHVKAILERKEQLLRAWKAPATDKS